MNNHNRDHLHKLRLMLGNPYAYIEQLDGISNDEMSIVRATRRKLQDPYALIEQLENSPAQAVAQSGAQRRVSNQEIAQKVVELQRELWCRRSDLWPERANHSPLSVLDPAMAAKLLGFEFEMQDSLGVFRDGSNMISVAGQIDRSSKTVRIATEFDVEVQKFTAAHEIGHLVLHPNLEYTHRDRGLNGATSSYRNDQEREADKFAACFLMPEKIMLSEFRKRFLSVKFSLHEQSAYALDRKSLHESIAKYGNLRKLARRVAGAHNFNQRNFHSLATVFGVTVETMAIRLEELGLVEL